ELAVEQRMDADDAILLLDAAKDDVALWPHAAALAPHDRIAAQTIAKIARVDLVEDRAEVKVAALRCELKLPLKWRANRREMALASAMPGVRRGSRLRPLGRLALFGSLGHGRALTSKPWARSPAPQVLRPGRRRFFGFAQKLLQMCYAGAEFL